PATGPAAARYGRRRGRGRGAGCRKGSPGRAWGCAGFGAGARRRGRSAAARRAPRRGQDRDRARTGGTSGPWVRSMTGLWAPRPSEADRPGFPTKARRSTIRPPYGLPGMAQPPLPPLAAIRCFEAAARHQSFTRAARELGMTQAAVSYQIRILEDRLGGPLFLRGPRGVALTEAGRRLAPAVTEAFAALRAAFADLSEAAEGVLTVSAVNTFASNWLVPRLGAFQLAHPKIAVRLDVSGRLVDFAREEVDVG